MQRLIFKIADRDEFERAMAGGRYDGAAIDIADGFIHFSTAAQARETADRHFAGREGLLLVAVDEAALGAAIKYEPSRGGDLFPHLFAPLERNAVVWAVPLPIGSDGRHVFPDVVR
ncbi:MAG: DUF952 domain-containing protein [Phyllobacteriaceae bacterium]|nr:DUF952 domain-containing protein [Phyllobacteriaceae bacterium]